jgi:hypothetical protein
MNDSCKQIVKAKGIERRCRNEATESGYCEYHDPKAVAQREFKELEHDAEMHLREIRRDENFLVGAYLRLIDKERFDNLLKEAALKQYRRELDIHIFK